MMVNERRKFFSNWRENLVTILVSFLIGIGSAVAIMNLIRLINTRDFRTNSLQKQLLQKLISDGLITGTVRGTAE